MTIRLAAPGDAAVIADVHVRAWRHAYADLVPAERMPAEEDRGRRWTEVLAGRRQTVLVAEVEGRVVAFCALGASRLEGASAGEEGGSVAAEGASACEEGGSVAREGEVYALYVDPAAQGAGVGSGLMVNAVAALQRAGFTEAVVVVFEANGLARAFYEGRGWALDGPHEAAGDWPPMVRYRRAL